MTTPSAGTLIAFGLLIATALGVVFFVIVNWDAIDAFFNARPRLVAASWFALGFVLGCGVGWAVTYLRLKGTW